MVMFGWMR